MSVEPTIVDKKTAALVERNIHISFDFVRQIVDDPSILDDIPHGVVLVLLTGDDPEFDQANIEIGLAALRRGEDVYFRHYPVPHRSLGDWGESEEPDREGEESSGASS